jgi:hypothetical protein
MRNQLSPKVKELIAQARIVSFGSWQGSYPIAVINRFQTADDQGRYLTDEDIQAIQAACPELAKSLAMTQQLRDQATEIVDEARQQVLAQFPGITELGGELYPSMRAEACWRDFWHFLRCIAYGVAGQRADYTSTVGLQYMEQLYQELRVPLAAMVLGVNALKTASLKRLPAEAVALIPYFEQLIQSLNAFQKE